MTKAITRRGALAGLAGAAALAPAAAMSAAPPLNPDAALLALERELLAKVAAMDAGRLAVTDENVGEIADLEREIAAAPIYSWAGVALKLRRLVVCGHEGTPRDVDPLARTALDALTRITAGGVS